MLLNSVYFRFAICGASMAAIGAVLVKLLALFQVQYSTYLILCAAIYIAVSALNYVIQIHWVFNKRGKYLNYIFCSFFCSILFGFLNAEIYFAIVATVINASIVSYAGSMIIVAPVSFLLNKHIFRYDRQNSL